MKTAKAMNDQLTGFVEIKEVAKHNFALAEILRVSNKPNLNLRVIEWKPYPENKPERGERCLINRNVLKRPWVEISYFYEENWEVICVTAFAELPEPYHNPEKE